MKNQEACVALERKTKRKPMIKRPKGTMQGEITDHKPFPKVTPQTQQLGLAVLVDVRWPVAIW